MRGNGDQADRARLAGAPQAFGDAGARRAHWSAGLDFGDHDLAGFDAGDAAGVDGELGADALVGRGDAERAVGGAGDETDHAGGARLQLADRTRLVFVGIDAVEPHQNAIAGAELRTALLLLVL